MVKVKGKSYGTPSLRLSCFNHPMVKVKAGTAGIVALAFSFNHPMVKVKAVGGFDASSSTEKFQPPYGES